LFGKNYLLLRHEDLLCDTRNTLKSIYDFIETPLPLHVLEWTSKNVNSKSSVYAHNNPQWYDAFKILSMFEEMNIAGYSIDGK